MTYYINFYFRGICYDEDEITGEFSAPDHNVQCSFLYNRHTEECKIRNNNKPIEEIEPLPIFWLLRKLKETGKLNERESRECY
ncbi:MAG: hypothetical protein HDT42_12350 [Ruminococcaceae bacterium]|nr:hypothetical protein [Oscillospiraceae bacterium]